MPTKRDEIADAIIKTWHAFDDMKGSELAFRRALADAVLDVLREPDEGMVEAGMDAGPDLDHEFFEPETIKVWQAMIDYARTPPEGA